VQVRVYPVAPAMAPSHPLVTVPEDKRADMPELVGGRLTLPVVRRTASMPEVPLPISCGVDPRCDTYIYVCICVCICIRMYMYMYMYVFI